MPAPVSSPDSGHVTRVPGLVSVIVPVFERPALVCEAVRSILTQDYRPIEVLVIDDGSRDDTPQALARLAGQHPEVVPLRVPNGGPGLAREAGRQRARGSHLLYLDSDDLLLPGALAALAGRLAARPDCAIAYGFARYRDPQGQLSLARWKASGHAAEYLFPSFLRERWWETGQALFRATLCDAVGPWASLRLEEDWEHDSRVAALHPRLVLHPDFVVEVRRHASGHLSGQRLDPARLRDRATAQTRILGQARRAGVAPAGPEMRHAARALFLLARQCGAADLPVESRRLFELARDVARSTKAGRAGLDFALYRALAALVGWTRAGWLAEQGDRLRAGRR
jgi:hypothetical protein